MYLVLFRLFLSCNFIGIRERWLFFTRLSTFLRFLSFILHAINPIYCMRIRNFHLSNVTAAATIISSVNSLPKNLIEHDEQLFDGDINHQLY